jgi:hypothetical protein
MLVNREKQFASAIVGWQSGDDPGMPEELAKQSFLHGARGGYGCRQGQLLGSIRPIGNDC